MQYYALRSTQNRYPINPEMSSTIHSAIARTTDKKEPSTRTQPHVFYVHASECGHTMTQTHTHRVAAAAVAAPRQTGTSWTSVANSAHSRILCAHIQPPQH